MIEAKLYNPVKSWLKKFLSNKYSRKLVRVIVDDVHTMKLSDFISSNQLESFFPEYACFDIKVDVAGVAVSERAAYLAIVEVKRGVISVANFSQILGYARIVKPHHAFILSPLGWCRSLHKLIADFNRYDILSYGENLSVVIGKWDIGGNTLKLGETLYPR